ncbi:MAG: DUF1345 domain-containing protein [Burkholderiales bacterium]|nr:DUF1345 domain-containing protein [Burkholderiales bacterium]
MAAALLSPMRVVRFLRARPQLLLACALGALAFAAAPDKVVHQLGSRFLLAWNAGALLYLLLAGAAMFGADTDRMKQRALRHEEGRSVVLVLVVMTACAVLYAIAVDLVAARSLSGTARAGHVAMAVLTLLTSWLFTQTMFAFQYAHDFYLARQRERADPLSFPGTVDPAYTDFMYFACVIGTSAQTADVAFNGAGLRGIGLLHCVLAFFFNTTVLALTINIAAGLYG